jgi:hypothetical protein
LYNNATYRNNETFAPPLSVDNCTQHFKSRKLGATTQLAQSRQSHGIVYFYLFHDIFTMGALLPIESAPIVKRQH